MATWIEPITDRTQFDVDRLKQLNSVGYRNFNEAQKAEWEQDSKGALNRSDLLRIENNIKVLSDIFNLNLTTYDDTNLPDIPTVSYFTHLKQNLQAIRDAYIVKSNTPQVPTSPLNTFQKWNDIETILLDVEDIHEKSSVVEYYASDTPELYSSDPDLSPIGLI